MSTPHVPTGSSRLASRASVASRASHASVASPAPVASHASVASRASTVSLASLVSLVALAAACSRPPPAYPCATTQRDEGAPDAESWRALGDSCGPAVELEGALQPRLVRRLGDGWHIVWLARDEGGLGRGPLALVLHRGRALEAHTLGLAEAPLGEPTLERVRLGERELWVLSGERCEGARCERHARVYERVDARLRPVPAAGSDLDAPASLLLARSVRDSSRDARFVARLELDDAGRLAVAETVTIRERRGDAMPIVHEANVLRPVALTELGLRVERASLADDVTLGRR